MTTTTATTTTRAPVPGRRLLAALGLWTAIATAVGAATFLTAQAIAPQWATATNLGTVIAAEVYTALVVVPYVVVFGIVTGWLRELTGLVAAGFVTHVLQLAVLVIVTFLLAG